MEGEEQEIRFNERGKIEECACSEKANKSWEEIRKNKKEKRKGKTKRKEKRKKNQGKQEKKGRTENQKEISVENK